MGTVETRSKTPVEGSSRSPANDKPRGSDSESKNLKEALSALKGGHEVPAKASREIGFNFSSNGNGGLGDDADVGVVEVVKSRVVEAKIPGQRGREIDISSANDCQGLGDSEMNGVSSLLKMRESGRNLIFSQATWSDGVEKSNSVYASSGGGKRSNRKKREGDGNDEKIVTIEVPIAETEEIDASSEGNRFSVGDFVWGKIKSHPWWPGRIYDPEDASDYALKLRQKNRLLVAYFGDRTFAWCHPSQLKPFEENFGDMVKQSNSRAFVNAVQDAVNEIGWLLDLKMSNSWLAKKNRTQLEPLLAKNSGIKDGVLVPENGVEKLSTFIFDPSEILSRVKKIAEVIAFSSVLELEILKARLSAFFLSRGGYKLPNYHTPQPVPGLENNSTDERVDKGSSKGTVNAPVQGPFEEDYLSSPLSPKSGEKIHSSGTSGNRLHHRRKQKSIAEIIREDSDFHTKVKEGDETEEVMNSGKLTRSSGRKKRKSSEDATTTTQVQKLKGLRSSDQNVPSTENDGSGGKDSAEKVTLSHLKKKKENIGNKSSEGKIATGEALALKEENLNRRGAKEQNEKGYFSRERKKSKYLSPPFTTPGRGQRKGDKETTSVKVSGEAQPLEQLTGAVGELLGSPPPSKSDSEAFQENTHKETAIDHDVSDRLNSQTPVEEKNKTIDLKKIQASPGEVLSQIRFAAINPQIPKGSYFLDKIVGFVSIFRSSVYRQGSYYTLCNKRQPGRKRKNPESEPATLRKHQNQTDQLSPNPDSEKRKRRKKIETASETLKQNQTAENRKTGKKGTKENASAAALIVSFGPGSSLPSKSELIKLYGKFGSLNEAETDIICTNYTAQVYFLKTSDAEEAFNHSKNVSPFGSCSVKFELRYLSAGSKPGEKSQTKASPAKKKDKTPAKPSASQSSTTEASKLNFIKQKLEAMTLMLEGSGGKSSGIKKKLESEIKGLLEDVNKMAESSSS